MSGILNDSTIDLPCPGCGHETPKTIGWLKRHKEYQCAGCKETVNLDTGNLMKEIRKVENEFRKLGF